MENDGSAESQVGQRVRALRVERAWSQSELGQRLGEQGYEMTQGTIAKLEAGLRPIRVNEVVALAAVFGMPFIELLPHEKDVVVSEYEQLARSATFLTSKVRELEEQLRYLSREARAIESAKRDAEAEVAEIRKAIRDTRDRMEAIRMEANRRG